MTTGRSRFPLFAKMLLWLLLHLAVLAAAFVLFVGWQLRLGLDSLLSGAAGERLKSLGSVVGAEMRTAPTSEWGRILEDHTAAYGIEALLVLEGNREVTGSGIRVPADVGGRLERLGRRPAGRHGIDGPEAPGLDGPGPPLRRAPGGGGPMREGRGESRPELPEPRPVFLCRSNEGGYWAAVDLPLFQPGREPPRHGMLLLHSADASAAGLFFELRPWLLGGLAVLALSLLVWGPFIASITRYTTRLSRATERIAEGRFEVRIAGRRRDELGTLGRSIERMADRLDHLLRGQRRFLGDVAHELCSPLARIRTGLGVLEHQLGAAERERLASIDEDVGELSELVGEILAFTRAATAPQSVRLERVGLRALVDEAVATECPDHPLERSVAADLAVRADRRLLGRAIANVLRNADRHGGRGCPIRVHASAAAGRVRLSIEDGGPGVDESEIPKLFEPFYRPDGARTREAGGAGLGLAIVRSAVEACGGTVEASRSTLGGLRFSMDLEASDPIL